MVDGWADNTEYEATIIVKTGAGPQRNVAEVTSFTPEDMEETPDEDMEPAPEASGAAPAKPAGKMPAMKY